MENGSSISTNTGSTIKASTNASQRRESVPNAVRTYEYASGGSIVLPESRRAEAMKSKNERKVLAKELSMARVYAQAGDRIEFSSKSAGTHDIYANGIPADFKKLSSHNNIVKEAKKAVGKQGAKLVFFSFNAETPKIHSELNKLPVKGIHGKYYFGSGGKIFEF